MDLWALVRLAAMMGTAVFEAGAGGLPLRTQNVFPIYFGAQRIGEDVLPDFAQFIFVAHDVFVIVPLPEFSSEIGPSLGLDSFTVPSRGQRFEPLH